MCNLKNTFKESLRVIKFLKSFSGELFYILLVEI